MIKILKNVSGSDVTLQDAGVTVHVGESLTIDATQYPSFAQSSSAVTAINAGTLVVNDGISDLPKILGVNHLKDGSNHNVIRVNPTGANVIGAAIASISDASASNPYLVKFSAGTFNEAPFALKPHVHLIGPGFLAGRIVASNTGAHLITAVENSSISDCFITGVTGSGFAAIYMASATASDTTPFLCQNVKFGNNDTHAIVSSINANQLLIVRSCLIGGEFQFNNGFKATTTGSGSGRVLLMNCTTSTMTAPLPNYVGYATGTGCQIIVNACQFNTGGTSSGSCIQVDSGAQARLMSLNAKGYAKALWVPNTGSTPTLFADPVTLEGNTQDIQIDHPTAIGNVIGIATLSKVTNNAITLGLFLIDQTTGVSSVRGLRTKLDPTVTSASTLTLTGGSGMVQLFTGSTSGQILQLPDASTLQTGHRFEVWNMSTTNVSVNNGSSALVCIATSGQRGEFVLSDNSTTAGVWRFVLSNQFAGQQSLGNAYVSDDFISGGPTGPASSTSTFGILGWGATGNTGTGLTTYSAGEVNHPGILSLQVTSFQKADIAEIDLFPSSLVIGSGQNVTIRYLIRFPTLSDSTNQYLFRCGLTNDNASQQGVSLSNGAFFTYSSNVNSAKFQCTTRAANTSTQTDSGITVATNTWYLLSIAITGNSTVVFSINGVVVATHTTNIPSAAIGPVIKMDKTNGNAGLRQVDLDFFDYNLTVNR